MRALRWGLTSVLAVFLLVLAWSTWQAWQVRTGLLSARDGANQVRQELSAGNLDVALEGLPGLQQELRSARRHARGPIWSVAEHAPLLGRNFVAVRRAAQSAELLGQSALPAAAEALQLARREQLVHGGAVDLKVLARLRGHVERAANAAETADRLVANPPRLVLPPVGSGLSQMHAVTGELAAGVVTARDAMRLAPGMLGETRARTFLVAVQNDAEARATGGLIGAYALIRARGGALALQATGVNDDLPLLDKPQRSDPAAARTWVNLGSTSAWYDVNLTPHFPDAARNLAGLWAAKTGQQVDGVVALDALVMSHLLRATGPARLPDGTSVSAADVEAFIGHDEYVRYPDVTERKRVLSSLADELFQRLLATRDTDALLRAVTRAGTSGHLFVWSRDRTEQARLAKSIVGGSLPADDRPYLAVLTQNFGGNKLDYYLRRKVRIDRAQDDQLKVTVELLNTAPLGLPEYMTVRSDKPTPPPPYGQSEVALSVYGARSSEVASVSVNGRPAQMSFDRDHGHRLGTLVLELPRNKPLTVTITLSQPSGVLEYRRQPMVVRDDIDSRVPVRIIGH